MNTTGLLVVLGMISLPVIGQSGERPILLSERLGRGWTNQLVQEKVVFEKGACVAESVRLTGPRGAVPVQLTDVVPEPGKPFVKSATAWFIVDELAPLATNVYRLSYGPAPSTQSHATPLAVKADPGQAEILSGPGGAGFRASLGAKTFDPAVPAGEAPPLLRGLRLSGGEWSGEWRLKGEAKVKSWEARLIRKGPVSAAVETRYDFEDGNRFRVAVAAVAGDSALRVEMETGPGDVPALAVLPLPAWPGVKQALLPKGYGQWAKADRTAPVTDSTNTVCSLAPDSSLVNIFPEFPSEIRLAASHGGVLRIESHEPAAWAEPVPMTYGGQPKWNLHIVQPMWERWRRNVMPLTYEKGTPVLRAPLVKGRRVWSVGAGAEGIGTALDTVNGMVLDWPANPKDPHPRLFVDGKEMASNSLAKPTSLTQLRTQLEKYGYFDVMRSAISTVSLYDALISTDLVPPAEKPVLRARMAYLAYVMADPQCWSMEHGFASGNPNMSISYTLSLGVLACALRDHPMAKTWAARATAWMSRWLDDEVGPNGEWLPEGSHYSYVSLEPLLAYAVAARRAGFADFTDDARLKKLLLFFMKYQTPPDPQRQGFRVSAAHGRGTSGEGTACFGVMAGFYGKRDPSFAKTLQWMWAQNGYPTHVGDNRFGGFEEHLLDKARPMEAPAWGSEAFPELGVLLRHGFNTPSESQVNALAFVQSTRNLDVWTPQVGALAQWYARGKPLNGNFTFELGYNTHHDLFKNGVRLPHPWAADGRTLVPFGCYSETKAEGFAALPGADYVRSTIAYTNADPREWKPPSVPVFPKEPALKGEPRLTWTRQTLFLKAADPAGPAYLVLRDTTAGGQPTVWQFWTHSEKIGTPEQAADREAFLAGKPGWTNMPARPLPGGARYTAAGTYGVDAEFFIASPADGPRHTLRYGGVTQKRREYMDLLHLQLPGDGVYYAVVYPRLPEEKAPAFAALDGGKIIKVTGEGWTDHALLAAGPVSASAEGVSLSGTAAAVQAGPGGQRLTLGAEGEVSAGAYGLRAKGPASLAVSASAGILTLTLPDRHEGATVTVKAPGRYKAEGRGVKMEAAAGGFTATVPAGVSPVVFKK